MHDPCCSTMKASTITLDDIRGDPLLSANGIPNEWTPTVEWAEQIGAFVIGHTAIFYCPWCGAKLPDNTEEVMARARAKGSSSGSTRTASSRRRSKASRPIRNFMRS